jgi:hypothetical protein
MFLKAELSHLPAGDGRKAERRIVNIAAALRESGATTTQAEILNISVTGFKAEVDGILECGTETWVKLPGCEAKRSRVVWAEGKEAGFEFESPFQQAELDTILRANRPRQIRKNIFRRR